MSIKQAATVQKHIDRIKELLWKQTANHPLGMPQYYGVLYYGKPSSGG